MAVSTRLPRLQFCIFLDSAYPRICGALHIRRFRLTTPLRILRHGIQKLAFSVFRILASAMSSTVI